MSSEKYFASQEPVKAADELLERAKNFFEVLEANMYLKKLREMWRFYYGDFYSGLTSGHQVTFTGEQGELINLPTNHFRNLAQHLLVMVTSNRPIMQARAINSDYKSLAQTYLADGILDYYMREKKMEDYLRRACEMAIVMGSGFIMLEWNATAGDEYDADPETGEIVKTGELEFKSLSPFDVVVDGTKEDFNNDWILIRTWKNRFDLAAKYPELQEQILGEPTKDKNLRFALGLFSNDKTDDIAVYRFYHKPTDALPEGRYIEFLGSTTILLDTKMPYRVIPVFRITAGEILGTPYGYSPMFDLMPLQQGINSLMSTVLTNQNAFGVQSVWVPRGADISMAHLQGGMNLIEGNAKPEPIQLTETPAEVFKFIEMLIQQMELISGVNSVARGNPEASLKSGNALALVQAMALQFVSGLQNSYVKLIEDTGTAIVQILKDYANTPKVVQLIGKNKRSYAKEFVGDDISSINRVVVDVGNPLARTIAGRVQMAEQMLQMHLIKQPSEYLQVIETGRLDVMYEGDTSQLMLVKSENERLSEGKQVQALRLDDHRLHIQEHATVLSDPDLRADPALVNSVLAHITEHEQMLMYTDPNLLLLTNQQPIQPPPQPQQPGQQQGGPPGQPGAQQGAPQPQQPSGRALQHSPNSGMMAPPTQPLELGKGQVQGPGVPSQNLPNLPKPASAGHPELRNLPVLPSQQG